jgi:hypothetical protein
MSSASIPGRVLGLTVDILKFGIVFIAALAIPGLVVDPKGIAAPALLLITLYIAAQYGKHLFR